MLKSGDIFAGRYRVEHELGRGGLGVVYACEHLHTGQRVAVKLLLAEPQRNPQLEAAVREKFKLEQKVWSHAPSEHIVRVLDAGHLDASGRELGAGGAGTLYMVMERLYGETLHERVERLRLLPPAEVSRILQQIARGLDVAHGCRGPDGRPEPIVHRDLTPRNVFITTQPDGAVFVKLLDFGIAKHLVEGALVTQVLLGTRLYSAPEQLLGHAISPQTDVWALGLIAYYALTGREYGPLSGPPLVSPSRRRREQGVGGRFPIEFDRWFSRCVEREPERRFASAGEAAAELALALSGAETLVPPPLVEDARPAALVSTVPQPVRPAVPASLPRAEASRASAPAEPPARHTMRLQTASPAAPLAALAQTAAERPVVEHPPPPATRAASAGVGGDARPAPIAASRRGTWGALALAGGVAGVALYLAWPEGARAPDEPSPEARSLEPAVVLGDPVASTSSSLQPQPSPTTSPTTSPSTESAMPAAGGAPAGAGTTGAESAATKTAAAAEPGRVTEPANVAESGVATPKLAEPGASALPIGAEPSEAVASLPLSEPAPPSASALAPLGARSGPSAAVDAEGSLPPPAVLVKQPLPRAAGAAGAAAKRADSEPCSDPKTCLEQ